MDHCIVNIGELVHAHCIGVLLAGKMADPMYGNPREGTLDL